MTDCNRIPLADGSLLNVCLDGPEGAPWVVLSNSVMTDLTVWDGQVAALSARYRVLRYDQRGHGQSELPAGPMSFDDYGADLLALLDACGVARCSFVGLSMGVPTGLAALAASPDRFTAFVAVDGVAQSAAGREAFWSERRDTARTQGMAAIAPSTAERWLPGVDAGSAKFRRMVDIIAATPVTGFAAATHALSRYDHSAALDLMTVPFLGITGEKDGAMPQAVRTQFAGQPEAVFADIPGAGHLPNFQSPDAFNDTLLAFLDATATDNEKETR